MEEPRWKYGNDVRYAYAVGVIRVLETRSLSRERIERAAVAATAEEVLRILAETSYSEYLSALKSADDYESFLEKEHEKTLAFVQNLTKDPLLTNLFLYRYDFHNLKVAAKERFGERDLGAAYIPFGLIPVPTIQAALMRKTSHLFLRGWRTLPTRWFGNSPKGRIRNGSTSSLTGRCMTSSSRRAGLRAVSSSLI